MPGTPITVAYGDGIGPEIMEATLRILKEAGAELDIQVIEVGEKLYLKGLTSGIEDSAWDSLQQTKVFLKAPITTPQGGGMKSLNVTIRKTLGLYANVRPCVSYHPYVATKHPKMDLVIIRENEEDLYAGIEYRQSEEVYQCLKLISRPGCERIVRYAFEYAVQNNRKKVTCITKDNIMKLTDGLFHKVFDEIAKEYPSIQTDHLIVDIGAARIADTPEMFDVIVTLNLYGDIISDIAAQVAGSVGLAGSSNVGEHVAMFEAIHGSAPTIAGQNIANPSGLLHGAIMMLVHINQVEVASRIHNAWLRTIEDGVHTKDIYNDSISTQLVGTKEFADAVISRLGQIPHKFAPIKYSGKPSEIKQTAPLTRTRATKKLVGVDIFIDYPKDERDLIGNAMRAAQGEKLEFSNISNRGVKVWPDGSPETFCTDHWRGRYTIKNDTVEFTTNDILKLIEQLTDEGFDVIKFESLHTFNGTSGFSLGQGQ